MPTYVVIIQPVTVNGSDRRDLTSQEDDSLAAASEASSILVIAKDICEQLRISWVPRRMSWSDLYSPHDLTDPRSPPVFFDVPSDHPVMFGDTLYVAPSMMGRLRPEEWRPIVASSMIYYSKLVTRKDFGIIIRMAPLVVLVGGSLYALLLAGMDFWDFSLLLVLAFVGVAIMGVFFLIAPYRRKLWLRADRIAADYVGLLVMIGALEKIQAFGIREFEGRRFSDKPSLGQRISKLRAYWTKTSGLS